MGVLVLLRGRKESIFRERNIEGGVYSVPADRVKDRQGPWLANVVVKLRGPFAIERERAKKKKGGGRE